MFPSTEVVCVDAFFHRNPSQVEGMVFDLSINCASLQSLIVLKGSFSDLDLSLGAGDPSDGSGTGDPNDESGTGDSSDESASSEDEDEEPGGRGEFGVAVLLWYRAVARLFLGAGIYVAHQTPVLNDQAGDLLGFFPSVGSVPILNRFSDSTASVILMKPSMTMIWTQKLNRKKLPTLLAIQIWK